MSDKILNQIQAKAIYSAICLLSDIGARVDMALDGPNVTVRENTLGHIVIKKWGINSQEIYSNKSTFATAYNIQ